MTKQAVIQPITIPNQLTSIVQELNTSLQTIQSVSLGNSETTQLITYTLIATAITGIIVYHYIKNQENI